MPGPHLPSLSTIMTSAVPGSMNIIYTHIYIYRYNNIKRIIFLVRNSGLEVWQSYCEHVLV